MTNNRPTSFGVLRQTAKFTPIVFSHKTEQVLTKTPKSSLSNLNVIKTSSKIILPVGKHHVTKQRKICWMRHYCDIVEKMSFMEDLLYFECSPLDFQCTIEAIIECPDPQGGTIKQEKLEYGPVLLDKNSAVRTEGFTRVAISATCLLDGNVSRSAREIAVVFDNGIILQGSLAYTLSNEEIRSIHITALKDMTIIIGGLNQRSSMQKVFNDGQWYQSSYQPTKLRFQNSQAFLSSLYQINRIKFNISKQRQPVSAKNQFLPRTTFQKPKLSTESVNKQTTLNQNQNQKTQPVKKSAPNSNFILNRKPDKEKPLKSSEVAIKQQKSSLIPSEENHPTSVQGEVRSQNYVNDFDMLFEDEEQAEELCLNDSFEEFDKKSAIEGDVKFNEIQKKKEIQKVQSQEKGKLNDRISYFDSENDRLNKANVKLRQELSILKEMGAQNHIFSNSSLQGTINELKRYQSSLKIEISSINEKLDGRSTKRESVQTPSQPESSQKGKCFIMDDDDDYGFFQQKMKKQTRATQND